MKYFTRIRWFGPGELATARYENFRIRKLKKYETNVYVGEVFTDLNNFKTPIYVQYPDIDDWNQIPASFKGMFYDETNNYVRSNVGRIFNGTEGDYADGRPCKFIIMGLTETNYSSAAVPKPGGYNARPAPRYPTGLNSGSNSGVVIGYPVSSSRPRPRRR